MNKTRLPSLIALRAFEAVARLGTMKGASEELHVTPGAISQLIKKLEEELAAQLFERRNRELILTAEGRKLTQGVCGAFDMLKKTVSDMPGDRPQKVVRIACEAPIAALWLAPRVSELASLVPELNVEIASISALSHVNLQEVDVLLATSQPDVRGIRNHCLGSETYSVVASPAYLNQFSTLTEAQIAGCTLLHVLNGGNNDIPSWCEWGKIAGVNVDAALRTMRFSQAFDQALYAAREGAGLLLAPNALVSKDLRTKRLIRPSGPTLSSNVFYWLGESEHLADSQQHQAVIRWLQREWHASLNREHVTDLAFGAQNVFALQHFGNAAHAEAVRL